MLFYSRVKQGNFGDDLNPWLWSRLAPEIASDETPRLFVGIGTIFGRRVPSEPLKIVFGSGYGYARPPQLDSKWHVYCVRGPLTAKAVGIASSLAITDPGVLVPHALGSRPWPEKRHKIAFMPHHQSLWHADWAALCKDAGIHCIDPRQPVDTVIAELESSELLLAEAMHGAIVADALRVPWIPVRLYHQFSELKWRDWSLSMNLDIKIQSAPPLYQQKLMSKRGLEQAAKKAVAQVGLGKPKWREFSIGPSSPRQVSSCLQRLIQIARESEPMLSRKECLDSLEARLLERLELVRKHWAVDRFEPPSS